MLADPKSQLYYPFQNTLIDGSGHGRDGTLGGSPACSFVAGGPRGRALYFPGTGYVATPSFGLSGTVVVFACWTRCKFKVGGTSHQSFICDAAALPNLWALRLGGTDDLYSAYYQGAGFAIFPSFFSSPFNDVWLHLCLVSDYVGKKVYAYRNGVPFGSPVTMTGTVAFPSASLVKYLGCFNPENYPLTDGYMANVQLWTLATMPTDAARNWNAKRLAMGLHPIW